jgi:predicted dehydrogenase
MGSVHLNAWSNTPGAEVTAVCTENPGSLSGNLNRTGGNLARDLGTFDFERVRRFAHWSELIADPELDIVDVCLPTDMHHEVTVAALSAGKHVLCEKPMALTGADCDRMLATSQDSGRLLMIGHVLRFWPEYRVLSRTIRSGDHGRVLAATFTRQCGLPDWSKWLPVDARSGGAVLDLLVHDIDQALMLFGLPHRAAAKALGHVDGVSASLIYDSGPEVRIVGGWFKPGTPLVMSFRIRFEQAELELTQEGLFLSDMTGTRAKVDVPEEDGYRKELQYFLQCVQSGEPLSECSPKDSAQAVKVALILKRARETGEQVTCSD